VKIKMQAQHQIPIAPVVRMDRSKWVYQSISRMMMSLIRQVTRCQRGANVVVLRPFTKASLVAAGLEPARHCTLDLRFCLGRLLVAGECAP
jgi:hypothetical protein